MRLLAWILILGSYAVVALLLTVATLLRNFILGLVVMLGAAVIAGVIVWTKREDEL